MSDLGLVFAEEEFDTDCGSPTVSDYTVIHIIIIIAIVVVVIYVQGFI